MTKAGRESKAVKDLPSITQVPQVLGEPKVKTAVTSYLPALGESKEDMPSITKVLPLSKFASAREIKARYSEHNASFAKGPALRTEETNPDC